MVLYLNMKLHPIGVEILAIGGSYACNVEIKNVFKGAIVANAVAIAVAHIIQAVYLSRLREILHKHVRLHGPGKYWGFA